MAAEAVEVCKPSDVHTSQAAIGAEAAVLPASGPLTLHQLFVLGVEAFILAEGGGRPVRSPDP